MTQRCMYCNRFMKTSPVQYHEECYDKHGKQFDERIEEMKQATEIKTDNRGGARVGAGRKAKGIRKPVSINLPEHDWSEINSLIKSDTVSVFSYSEYFKTLHDYARKENLFGNNHQG